MDQLIKNFPPELQEFAHRRQKEQGNDGTFNGRVDMGKDGGNFIWKNTPEGSFWMQVYSNGPESVKDHPSYPKIQTYDIY